MNKDNNKEWYQRSFNSLHLSEDFGARLDARLKENGKEKKMNNSIHGISRIAAAIVAGVVAFGSIGCYAADVGGIRTKVELWLNGEKQSVDLVEADDGSSYIVVDEDSSETKMVFSGMYYDEDGNEQPMSSDELVSLFNNDARLAFDENGKVTFFYKNLAIDVTDQISADGKLYIHVEDPQNPNTYFSFTGITASGNDCTYTDKPIDGITYYEADASGLTDEAAPAPEHSDNEKYSTTVISD